MKSIRNSAIVVMLLLFLVASFQNCAPRNNSPVQFASLSAQAGGGGGNGDFYDGKPEPGLYDRLLPDRSCGDNESPLGRITVTSSSIQLEKADAKSCTRQTSSLVASQIEYSAYNPRYLGLDEGVFVRRASTEAAPILPEVWCRRPSSTYKFGLDAVIEMERSSGVLHASVFGDSTLNLGAALSQLPVSRVAAEKQLRYTGAGYELTVDVVVDGRMKFTGRLKATSQGRDLEETLECRLAGGLDPATAIAPPPSSYRITGLTSASDAIADGFLVGTQSPVLNWGSLAAAFKYDAEIIGSDGTSRVCSISQSDASSPSASLATCALNDGASYFARLTASTVFGTTLDASNVPFRFVVTNPLPTSGRIEPQLMPGKIEVESYDNGGEGVGYHDTTPGNSGGAGTRGDSVDIVSIDGGLGVVATEPGEWLKYTVEAASDGSYEVSVGIDSSASGAVAALHLEVDGVDVTGPVTFQKTSIPGSFWQFPLPAIKLTKGVHIMKLVIDGQGFGMSHMLITLKP